MSGFEIAGRRIGLAEAPFVIAEMSGNHNQSLDRALAMVDLAASTGADAIKLQTYRPDTITLDASTPDFLVPSDSPLWKDRQLFDLYKEAHTPWEWHAPIFERARQKGIIAFSSAFDETAVDFLETLGVPAYKIASFEITHLPLIRKVAETGRPVIISTGMAVPDEIAEAIETCHAAGNRQVAILKCTSAYPAPTHDANVLTIPDMRATYRCEVGISDHTMGCGVSIAAVAHGASIIEKHFTNARADGGVDSAFSMEPGEFAILVTEARRARDALGQVKYGKSESDRNSDRYRRSIYFSRPLPAGAVISRDDVKIVRPGFGLAPRHLDDVIGAVTTVAVNIGDRVTWDSIATGR
jgi:N-acetylneuraminate synthase